MNLQCIAGEFSVCTVADLSGIDLAQEFCFTAKTDEELSLVCETVRVPRSVTAREDGWRALRVAGPLDFSLIGILAELSAVLAAAQIGIFVVSTYRTDYLFVKETQLAAAIGALTAAGHTVET